MNRMLQATMKQHRTRLELTHSGGKKGVVLIHKILGVITEGHWRGSLPGSLTCLTSLSRATGTAGRSHWREQTVSTRGVVSLPHQGGESLSNLSGMFYCLAQK